MELGMTTIIVTVIVIVIVIDIDIVIITVIVAVNTGLSDRHSDTLPLSKI